MCIHKLLAPVVTTVSIFFLFLIEISLCSVNENFEACASRSCGDGKNLSFPFYIAAQQPSYCGYPGFNVSCRNNQSVLGILSNSFLIHELFHDNHSFRVSDMGFLDVTKTCSIPDMNLSLAGIIFNVSPDYDDKLYLYNCSSKSDRKKLKSYVVGCDRNSSSSESFFAMFSSDHNTRLVGKSCHGVGTPIKDDEIATGTNSWEQYKEAVSRGFFLQWNAPNCTRCKNSGGRCGYDEKNFQFWCYCPDRPHRVACRSGRRGMSVSLKLGLGVGIGFGCGILVICFIVWLLHKRRSASLKLLSRNISSNSDMEMASIYFGVPVFSYAELKAATNNFDPDKELGDGGFGTVYYGILKDGRQVAVKRLYEHNYKRMEQFINEVELLTRVRHKNLVSLYGCTSRHSRELLLVYEYIPNGTVADHLFGERAQSSPLSWPTRMNIAIETASALAYLHASDIIHRDVKTNNILLDNNFCVKVADFGLSRVRPADVTHISTAPQGTPGYLDPEYHESYQLTEKSDVYSFGVVLIELISSLPAVDISRSRNEVNLASLAVKRIQNCMLDELIDPNLGYESDLIVKRMTSLVAELAFRCLQQDKEMRPSMDDVLEVLKEIANGMYDTEKGDLNTDCQEVKCMQVSQTLDPDGVVLLKDSESPPSPISVTEKWTSSTSTITPNTSA